MFGGEEFTGAARAGHDLVIDQQHAELVADFADAAVIAVGRDQRAGGGAADGLHDEGKHGVGALGEDLVAQEVGVFEAARLFREVVAVEIGGGGGDLGHPAQHRRERIAQGA